MKKIKKSVALILTMVLLLSLAGCGEKTSSSPNSSTQESSVTFEPTTTKDFSGTAIDIGCGTQGGFFYLYGSAIASALESYIPGLTATAMVTGGSAENSRRVSDGECDVIFANTDVALAAFRGEGDFEKEYPNIRHLISGNVQAFHLVVRADSDIQSYKDLAGKSVAVPTGNTFTQIFPATMEGFGVNLEDVNVVALASNECIEAIRDDTVDAGFVVQAPPYSVITDLALSVDLRIIEIPEDVIDKILTELKPYWGRTTVPAGTYNNIDKEIKTLGVVNGLYVNKDLGEDLVYEILKVIDTKVEELVISHPDAIKFVVDNNPFLGCGTPVHPGAVKYYEEHGVTVPEDLMP